MSFIEKKMSKINFFDIEIEGRTILKLRIFWIWRKKLKFFSFHGHITDIPKEKIILPFKYLEGGYEYL